MEMVFLGSDPLPVNDPQHASEGQGGAGTADGGQAGEQQEVSGVLRVPADPVDAAGDQRPVGSAADLAGAGEPSQPGQTQHRSGGGQRYSHRPGGAAAQVQVGAGQRCRCAHGVDGVAGIHSGGGAGPQPPVAVDVGSHAAEQDGGNPGNAPEPDRQSRQA